MDADDVARAAEDERAAQKERASANRARIEREDIDDLSGFGDDDDEMPALGESRSALESLAAPAMLPSLVKEEIDDSFQKNLLKAQNAKAASEAVVKSESRTNVKHISSPKGCFILVCLCDRSFKLWLPSYFFRYLLFSVPFTRRFSKSRGSQTCCSF